MRARQGRVLSIRCPGRPRGSTPATSSGLSPCHRAARRPRRRRCRRRPRGAPSRARATSPHARRFSRCSRTSPASSELDRGILARTGNAPRTAVKSSGLPHVGGSVRGARVSISSFFSSPATRLGNCEWLRLADEVNLPGGRPGWTPGGAEIGAGARLYVGRQDMRLPPLRVGTWRCCNGRGNKAVHGNMDLHSCSEGRAPGGVAVGAGARLFVG